MADLLNGMDQAARDRAEINAVADPYSGTDESIEIAAIRTDIEHTRHDIEDTLEAIKDKLNPQVVLEQAKEHAKEVAVDALDHARDNVKASVGATVDTVKESVGDAMHNAADAVGNAVHNVSDTVSNAVQTAKEKVSEVLGSGKAPEDQSVDKAIEAIRRPSQPTIRNSSRVGGIMSGMNGAGTSAIETVKRNPVPTALIAVGATYLYLKHRDENKVPTYGTRDYDYTDYDPLFPTSQPISTMPVEEEIIIIETTPVVDNQPRNAGVNRSSGGSSLLDTMSQNPLPVAAALVGAMWLLSRSRDNGASAPYRRGGYTDYLPPDTSPGVGSKIGDVVDSVKDKAGHVGEAVSGAVVTAKDKVADAVDTAKDAVGTARDKVGDVVDTAKDKVSSAVDTARDKAGQAGNAVSGAVSAAKEKATQATEQAKDRASQLGSAAVEHTRRAQGAVSDTFHENPMAYGLVALGIGAAVGLLIPATEPENRFMGQKRDELFNKAQSAASDIANKVQAVAEETFDAAKTTAVQEAKNQGLAVE